jgi:heme exporter protein D
MHMKKVLAAFVAAAFSMSIAGAAMAVPAQVSQQHSSISQVQDQATPKKKKKAAKKSTKKKQTAKKPTQKKKQAA